MTEKKMGRPPKNKTPMTKQMVVRMSEEMFQSINDYAEKHDTGKMEVIRLALQQFFKEQ